MLSLILIIACNNHAGPTINEQEEISTEESKTTPELPQDVNDLEEDMNLLEDEDIDLDEFEDW